MPGASADGEISYSSIEEKIMTDNQILGISPRIQLYGTCQSYLPGSTTESCVAFIQDTDKEKELGVGRTWDHARLEKGECHATSFCLTLCIFD